ncbi:cupin domain-containing protein [Cedecea davisae]|uniref:cupin domain-containing protein n=1 Tax=Cedecea davisae TaxID=158484 RepID=UPI00242A40CF|nr:cupin domain-containing protein [Cedecea davisae]
MNSGSLTQMAFELTDIWKSQVLGKISGANIKLIKMGGEGIPVESHAGFDELLVVIEGEMDLQVGRETIRLKSGDFYLIPVGAEHRVLPGSHGTLLLVDRE